MTKFGDIPTSNVFLDALYEQEENQRKAEARRLHIENQELGSQVEADFDATVLPLLKDTLSLYSISREQPAFLTVPLDPSIVPEFADVENLCATIRGYDEKGETALVDDAAFFEIIHHGTEKDETDHDTEIILNRSIYSKKMLKVDPISVPSGSSEWTTFSVARGQIRLLDMMEQLEEEIMQITGSRDRFSAIKVAGLAAVSSCAEQTGHYLLSPRSM